MPVATRTLLQLYTAVADSLQVRATGTLTAASTTALTAANHPYKTNRTDASTKRYEGAEVYLEAAAANVTPNPNSVAVYAPSTGIFTPGITYANAPGSSLTFDLFLRGVTRQDIIDSINECLRNIYYETLHPLTLVTDGDMETSGTGSWTASNATLTKGATAGNFETGTQGMRVLATAATGYAQSASIVVDPSLSASWRVRAWVRAQVGTARLIPYDVTNAANITTVNWTYQGPGVLVSQFQLPASCESLAFRLMGVANADDTYWDNVVAAPTTRSQIQLPIWVVTEDQVRRILEAPWESGATNRADRRDLHEVGIDRIIPDHSNPEGMFTAQLRTPARGMLYLEALRPYATLTLDADTTFCPRELIELGGSVELLKRLKNRVGQDQAAWNVEYRTRLSEWKKMYHATGPEIISRNTARAS